jgi:hypothetical protein
MLRKVLSIAAAAGLAGAAAWAGRFLLRRRLGAPVEFKCSNAGSGDHGMTLVAAACER